MVERLLEHGELEARLQIAIPNQKLKIRSLAWTGDEVGNRLRLERYATTHESPAEVSGLPIQLYSVTE